MKKICALLCLSLSMTTVKGINLSGMLAASALIRDLPEIIRTADLIKLQRYLTEGFDVDRPIFDQDEAAGVRLLHFVSGYPGDTVSLIRFLIDHHANVNIHDAQGATPLHFACDSCNLGCARELLRAGAQVNAVDLAGQTALQIAAKKGNSSLVTLLLE